MSGKGKNSGDNVVKEGLQRIGGLSGFARTQTRKRDSPFNFGAGNTAEKTEVPKGESNTLPIDEILLSPYQPRSYFDEDALDDLAASIKEVGILQPLVVRNIEDGSYQLIAGERRLRAAKKLGLKVVPVIIKNLGNDQARQIALIENLQREDLNPIEETESLLDLLAFELKITRKQVVRLLYQLENSKKGRSEVERNIEEKVQEVFRTVGGMKWESFIRTRLPLLSLPVEILEAVRDGTLAFTKAMVLNGIKDAELRASLLEKTINEKLSIRKLKDEISNAKKTEVKVKPEVSPLEMRLTQIYRMKKAVANLSESESGRLSELFDEIELLLGRSFASSKT